MNPFLYVVIVETALIAWLLYRVVRLRQQVAAWRRDRNRVLHLVEPYRVTRSSHTGPPGSQATYKGGV